VATDGTTPVVLMVRVVMTTAMTVTVVQAAALSWLLCAASVALWVASAVGRAESSWKRRDWCAAVVPPLAGERTRQFVPPNRAKAATAATQDPSYLTVLWWGGVGGRGGSS